MEPAGVMENKCDPFALLLKSMHICTSYCVPPNCAISCNPTRGSQLKAAGAPVLSDFTPVSCCVAVPLRRALTLELVLKRLARMHHQLKKKF